MTRSTRKLKSNKTDKEFVNFLINSLPAEAYVSGLNKNLDDRHKADKVLENRAWERYKAKNTPRKEKWIVYAVTNAMKAKTKIGMGSKGKRKRVTKNNSMLAAKKKRTSEPRRKRMVVKG
ncbi:Uncharacterized protein FWK35_00023754 [Aphis craccivora]|uniref:Uncharacterized protein n=1 Tax=Aphis craccivora TaxID=307492 RepID=A0A6G0VRN1_APHCR|nr:Uncharacterized protein FWK35_00023754 [Aphis craccivora]